MTGIHRDKHKKTATSSPHITDKHTASQQNGAMGPNQIQSLNFCSYYKVLLMPFLENFPYF